MRVTVGTKQLATASDSHPIFVDSPKFRHNLLAAPLPVNYLGFHLTVVDILV